MTNKDTMKTVVITLDVTDILKSIELEMVNSSKKFETASGATIDQIEPSSIVEQLVEDIFDKNKSQNMSVEYIKEILKNNYLSISRLLSTKLSVIFGDLNETEIAGLSDVSVTRYGILTVTLMVYID